jgi:hypothetical protein
VTLATVSVAVAVWVAEAPDAVTERVWVGPGAVVT